MSEVELDDAARPEQGQIGYVFLADVVVSVVASRVFRRALAAVKPARLRHHSTSPSPARVFCHT